MGPTMQKLQFVRSRSNSPDIFLRWFTPELPKAALLVVHGFGEHGGRYEHVAEALAARGYASLRIDYRGWGRAGGRPGYIERFGEYLDDIQYALEELGSGFARGLPVFLLGHSQGGLVVGLYAACRSADTIGGVVLVSPALRFALRVPPWKIASARLASFLWPTFSLSAGIDTRLLTHDPNVYRSVVTDPLYRSHATARWYTESLAAQQELRQRAASFNRPLLLLIADEDRIADPDAMEDFFRACGSDRKDRKRYPGLFHEILNELPAERARALSDLVEWLDAEVGAAPAIEEPQ